MRGGEFRVVRFGGRPILAARGGRRARLAGLMRYGANTPKRRAFRRAMRLLTTIGIDGVVARDVRQPVEGLDVDAWLDEVRGVIGARGDLDCVLVWPPEMRRKRLYAHLLDQNGRAVAFAKIAMSEDEQRGVRNEGLALGSEWIRGCEHFHAPEMIGEGEMAGMWTLLSEPLPEAARSICEDAGVYSDGLGGEIGGESRWASGQEVQQLGWYRRFLDAPVPGVTSEFLELAGEAAASGAQLWRAHGDMGPGNMALDGDRLWIFDWESWDLDAPLLSDPLGFHMGLNWVRWRDDPMAGAREIAGLFGVGGDVALALAFRRSTGVTGSDGIIQRWTSIRGSTT